MFISYHPGAKFIIFFRNHTPPFLHGRSRSELEIAIYGDSGDVRIYFALSRSSVYHVHEFQLTSVIEYTIAQKKKVINAAAGLFPFRIFNFCLPILTRSNYYIEGCIE